MAALPQTTLGWRLKPWQTILLFGILQSALFGVTTFFFDFIAGGATLGFGVWPKVGGTGLFYVYMVGYFNALVVILPVLLLKRFGVGTSIYLPYALIGVPVDLFFESDTLISPWAAVGWGAVGLAAGLSVDLAYRYLPRRLTERTRAILMGIVLGVASFLLTLLAQAFFYRVPLPTDPGSFVGVAYFGLPWLLVTSAFGGYTAYALSRNA
jgi:hypothetical protein